MPSLREANVAFVVPHYANTEEGSSVRSVAIARKLAEHCKSLTIITPDLSERALQKKGTLPTHDGTIKLSYMRGLRDYRNSFARRLAHEALMAIRCYKLIKQSKADLVIGSYPPAFTPLSAVIYGALSARRKVVLEVRDLMAGALQASGYARSRWLIKLAHAYEALLIKKSDAVAIVSPGMTETVAQYTDPARILSAYNGIEDTMLSFSFEDLDTDPALLSFYTQTGLTPGQPFVLYAGALTQSYDLPTLIDGFDRAQLPDTKFVILGNGEKRQYYEAYVREHGLEDRIVFHDFVDRISALKIISKAQIAVHAFNESPHWGYVLGNKMFDYIAMGTPVLYAGIGTTAQLIVDSKAGAVAEPGNKDDVAVKLQALATGAAAYKANPLARSYVREHWRRSVHTDKFIAHLTDLMQPH